MNLDKIRIYKFFGKKRQYKKAEEEFKEVLCAYFAYKAHRSKDNLLEVVRELDDLLNVLEGISAVEWGMSEQELHADKEWKIHRTLGIMSKCKKPGDYEKIRKG